TNFAEKVKVEDFHVNKYIGISKEYNVFELQKALSAKQILKANQIINYFSANPKSNPTILVLYNLFSYFNKLLLVHGVLLKNRGAGNNEIASTIGVNPYFVKEYMMAVKNYPLGKVINNLSYIRDIDMKLKGLGASGSQSEGSMMKELIFKILH
ncbi:MAG: DNA polymerase III subunit delta, partial [Cyclobacteriaceae bacterium]